MKGNDLVSIIIPVYNAEPHLRKCLQSAVNQTYPHLEIIVVNDGSSDKSEQICREFQANDRRICFINKENGGVSSARNEALNTASGKYIAFIDSDDYVSEHYIEILLKTLTQHRADIAECGAWIENETTGERREMYPRFQSEEGNIRIASSFCRNEGLSDFLWNKLFRAELFDSVRFSDFRCSEDFELLCHILLKTERAVSVHTPLYCYVRHTSSTGMEIFSDKKLDAVRARQEVFRYYRSIGREILASMVAVQILSQVIILYAQIAGSQDSSSKKYKTYLIDIFRNYYSSALAEKHSLRKDLFRRIKYKSFLIAPDCFSKIWGNPQFF